jgi:O-antigen ligase
LKVTGALCVLILAGVLAAGRPKYAVLAAAPYVAWLLWCHTAARLCFVVLGGVFVLSSGVNHLTVSKAGYFGGVAVAAVAILRQPQLWRALSERTPFRALAPLTLAIGVIMLVSLPVAQAEHTHFSPWFRDAAAYGLLAAAPLFIWEAARADSIFGRLAPPVLYTAAILSGLSGILEWLTRRQVIGTGTSINSHLLPGEFLPAAAAFLIVVEGSRPGRRHGRWYAAALAFPLCIFLGGTREAALLFVCVAVAASVYPERRRQLVPWGAAIVMVGVVAVASLVTVGRAGHPGMERIAHRLTSVPHVILHLKGDESYRVRAGEWHEAWETFRDHPFLGVGPGHGFGYSGAVVRSSYKLDTPIVYLAKFGLLGLLALAVATIALVRFTHLAKVSSQSPAWAALAWFLGFALLNLPFEMPFELKDFTLGLVVLGGLAARDTLPESRLVALWRETVVRDWTRRSSA